MATANGNVVTVGTPNVGGRTVTDTISGSNATLAMDIANLKILSTNLASGTNVAFNPASNPRGTIQ